MMLDYEDADDEELMNVAHEKTLELQTAIERARSLEIWLAQAGFVNVHVEYRDLPRQYVLNMNQGRNHCADVNDAEQWCRRAAQYLGCEIPQVELLAVAPGGNVSAVFTLRLLP